MEIAMTTPATDTERTAKRRARLKGDGKLRKEIWVTPAQWLRVKAALIRLGIMNGEAGK
jgi:hypothetical protein